jgi:hypothetical protein
MVEAHLVAPFAASVPLYPCYAQLAARNTRRKAGSAG